MTNVFCIVCIAKERKVLELDVKKGVTELKAQKKVLEDKELALAPIDLSFDRVKFGCYHAQFLEKLFKKPIGKLKMNKMSYLMRRMSFGKDIQPRSLHRFNSPK